MTLLRLTGPHWCKETGPSNKDTGPSNKETGPSNKEETGLRGPAWLSQYCPSLPKLAFVPDQATGGTVYTGLLSGQLVMWTQSSCYIFY